MPLLNYQREWDWALHSLNMIVKLWTIPSCPFPLGDIHAYQEIKNLLLVNVEESILTGYHKIK